MVRGAEECTSGGQVQMKHCHRRRGAQLLSGLAGRTHPFAWFSEGKAGPSLAPWSPEAQVAPVLAYQPP